MGRRWDTYTGTQYPDRGVTPQPATHLRAALLALNGTEVPFVVRAARPEEKADLVAEWRIQEPAWQSLFARSRLNRQLRIRMRLIPEKCEVRTLDEQWEVTWVGTTPTFATSRQYSRGPATTVSQRWTYEQGPDGRRRRVETFSFDSRELKDPLRTTVLGAGWTWRGVVFKL
ncbi:hypothetical protein GCM10017744_068980 [Streptomyces antimycoticus]|uniref:Uncharacterized protein n=1 Tax=Streptomyces antimycoticus TaxID=68175 RepID=A0A4D4K0F5_9ACTN|nr:hypothetical protein [Streptomyces antimycoticus]GDY42405.1 hypothetical protein SANT12839_032870 [Streptomyces antimycoticus]